MKNTFECFDHLVHCIQESEGISLSDKSKTDILKTMFHANKKATESTISLVEFWRELYYREYNKNKEKGN